MDGENNGKPDFLMDDLGVKTHHFRKPPCRKIWEPKFSDAGLSVKGIYRQEKDLVEEELSNNDV